MGTTSLSVALEQLGYTPTHGEDLFEFADEMADLYSGKLQKEDMLPIIASKGFDATGLDHFGWLLYPEAIATPSLKVILMKRDPAAWADSVSNTIGQHPHYLSQPPFIWLPMFQKIAPFLASCTTYYTNGRPKEGWNVTALAEGVQKHENDVREMFESAQENGMNEGRFLEYRIQDGWEPLCEFLEISSEESVMEALK